MPRFRKKPVVIGAVQWNGTNLHEIRDTIHASVYLDAQNRLVCPTLENQVLYADIGDWIICGVKGEVYPCKPDIFAATYDPADDAAHFRGLAAVTAIIRDASNLTETEGLAAAGALMTAYFDAAR